MQLCGSLSILWHSLPLGLEWKLTFSSPVTTVEFPHLLAYWVQHSHSIIFQDLKYPHKSCARTFLHCLPPPIWKPIWLFPLVFFFFLKCCNSASVCGLASFSTRAETWRTEPNCGGPMIKIASIFHFNNNCFYFNNSKAGTFLVRGERNLGYP